MSVRFFPCLICTEEFSSPERLQQHENDKDHVTRPAIKADKTKARQAYLDALYKNRVMVEREDRKRSIQFVTTRLNAILAHVRQQSGGDVYRNEIRIAGSHSTGTKVQLADEFDFILPWTEVVDGTHNELRVGYIFEDKLFQRSSTEASVKNLNVPRNLIWHPAGGQDIPKGYTNIKLGTVTADLSPLTFDGDLIARKVQEDLYSKIKRAIRELGITDMDLNREAHGPAITLNLKQDGDHHINLDVTVTVDSTIHNLKSYGWPRAETKTFLTAEHIQRVLDAGAHLVPKGGEFWKISFSKAERALMQGIDSGNECRRMCHKILKSDFHKWQSQSQTGFKGISSYVLKHQMFWMSEEKSDVPGYWLQSNLGDRYVDMLGDLRKRLEKRRLPDYFIPSENILENKDANAMDELIKFIDARQISLLYIFS